MVKGIGSPIEAYRSAWHCQRWTCLSPVEEAEGRDILCDANHDQLGLDDMRLFGTHESCN